jgi:transposase-like protein
MSEIKKSHPAGFKIKVALEALKGAMTIAQISAHYSIHSTQINRWKKVAVELLEQGFSEKKARNDKEHENLVEELYKQIGQLKVELEWLKKKSELLRG